MISFPIYPLYVSFTFPFMIYTMSVCTVWMGRLFMRNLFDLQFILAFLLIIITFSSWAFRVYVELRKWAENSSSIYYYATAAFFVIKIICAVHMFYLFAISQIYDMVWKLFLQKPKSKTYQKVIFQFISSFISIFIFLLCVSEKVIWNFELLSLKIHLFVVAARENHLWIRTASDFILKRKKFSVWMLK